MVFNSMKSNFSNSSKVKSDIKNIQKFPKSNKKARIIVRNLPFKNLSEDKLRQWFKEYGDIEEVKLLTKEDGSFVGCGFVQFTKVDSAARAVNCANEKEISGRKIIVDWAVPKNLYLEKLSFLQQEIKQEKHDISIKQEVDDSSNNSLNGEILPYFIDTTPDSVNFNEWKKSGKTEIASNCDDDDDDDDDDDNNNFEYYNSSLKKDNLRKSEGKNFIKSSDVEEGKTIFVRNIPFSATNENLKECFSKYGKIEYALICVDKLTEHSKGSGFVKFKDKNCAELCLQHNNKIFLEDNALLLTLALSKENLQNKKNEKLPKDSRNLYLAKEGIITAGSKAAIGVSASDMEKRLELERWKSQMLKNLNMFISDRRLIVHNLPNSYDDKNLKALFLKHSRPKANITEAKVMRDKKNVDKNGQGVSKELGFVTFSDHIDALTALRNINNNPNIFSLKRRPIVSFSIESRAALNAKKKRLEKSRLKLGILNDGKDDKLMKLNRKQRRFIMRRQKLIERRRETKKMKQEMMKASDKKTNKRKICQDNEEHDDGNGSRAKKKKTSKNEVSTDKSLNFQGLVSEPGKIVKLRTKFKLKNQVLLHKQQLKKEKLNRNKKKFTKLENVKEPRQKKGNKKFNNDTLTSKFITKHKKAIQEASSFKKWDEE